MNKNNPIRKRDIQREDSLFSLDFYRLAAIFCAMDPPYPRMDALTFASFYRSVYQSLTLHERKHAEYMVNLLIEGMNGPDLLLFHSQLMVPVELPSLRNS